MTRPITICVSAALIFGAAASTPASAQTPATYAYNFLKEVGCQLLPGSPCDLLDAEGAINLFRANQIMFMNKYCGTGYINGAKQLLDTGMALDDYRCRQVLQAMGEIR